MLLETLIYFIAEGLDVAIFLSNINLAKFLGVQKKRISEEKIVEVLREAAIEIYHDVIENTPQYSGYLASNLRIGVDGNLPEPALDLYEAHEKWRSISEPKSKGDDYAIGIAAAYNRGFNTAKMDIRSKVTIRYLASHWRVAEKGVALRNVNKPGQSMARAEAKFSEKFRVGWTQRYAPKGVFI